MLARDARRVAIDTTVVRYFFKAERLPLLISYLPKAFAFDDVARELRDQAKSRPKLAAQLSLTKWPEVKTANLASHHQSEILRVQAEWRRDDKIKTGRDPGEKAHLGELVSIFAAADGKADLLIMDERRGRALAGTRGLPVLSTPGLAIQMSADGTISEDDGWLVYSAALSESRRPEFVRLVEDQRP